MTQPDPMHLKRRPQRYQSDDGRYVDKVETDGDYETVYLREIEDGRYLVVGERAGGSRFTEMVEQTDERYIGLRPDGQRRSVPDDVQDALHSLGFTIRAHCVNELGNPDSVDFTESQDDSDSARQGQDPDDFNSNDT
jgi:hypothetical protein